MTRRNPCLLGLIDGALIVLTLTLAVTAAPVYDEQTALEVYDSESGCYYNYHHYGEGDRIITNEPCLNCTCHNRMLMCYLRVCPFTKPIGQDCIVEKREDQCCPVITCPQVPVELVDGTTASPSNEVAIPDSYGCTIGDKYYPEGVQVPSNVNKPCEVCYCIRNKTACVMQECTLHIDGCQPIYNKGVCCPVRYSCDHEQDTPLELEDHSTTIRPTEGFVITTPKTTSEECVYNGMTYADGANIKTGDPCKHCYCMYGDIVCAIPECGRPHGQEGKNCKAVPPKEGQCCADTFICDDETVTIQPEAFDDDLQQHIVPAKGVVTGVKDRKRPPHIAPTTMKPKVEKADKSSEEVDELYPTVLHLTTTESTVKEKPVLTDRIDENVEEPGVTEKSQEEVTEKTHDEPSISHEEPEVTEKQHEEVTEKSQEEVTEKSHEEPSISHEEPEVTEKPHEEPEVTEKTHDEPSISHEEPEATEKPHEDPEVTEKSQEEVTEKSHEEPSISHEEPEATEKPHEDSEVTEKTHDEPSLSQEEPEATEKPHEEPEVTEKSHDEPSISHEEPEVTEKPHEEPEVTEKSHDEPSISHEEPETTQKPHEQVDEAEKQPEVKEDRMPEEETTYTPVQTPEIKEHEMKEESSEEEKDEHTTLKTILMTEEREEPEISDQKTEKPKDVVPETTLKTIAEEEEEEASGEPTLKPIDTQEKDEPVAETTVKSITEDEEEEASGEAEKKPEDIPSRVGDEHTEAPISEETEKPFEISSVKAIEPEEEDEKVTELPAHIPVESDATEKPHDDSDESHEESEATEKPHEDSQEDTEVADKEPKVTEKPHDDSDESHEETEVTEKPSISHEEPEATEKPESKISEETTTKKVHSDFEEIPPKEIVTELPSMPAEDDVPESVTMQQLPIESDSHVKDEVTSSKPTVIEETTITHEEESDDFNTIIPDKHEPVTEPVTYLPPTTPKSTEIEQEMFPQSVPGEGACLFKGVTYQNNEQIPDANEECLKDCHCINSIVRCQAACDLDEEVTEKSLEEEKPAVVEEITTQTPEHPAVVKEIIPTTLQPPKESDMTEENEIDSAEKETSRPILKAPIPPESSEIETEKPIEEEVTEKHVPEVSTEENLIEMEEKTTEKVHTPEEHIPVEVTEKPHEEPEVTEKTYDEPSISHEEPEVTEKPHEEPEVTEKAHDEPSISHEEPEATEKPHEEPEVTEKTHDEPSISHEESEGTEKPHEEVTEKSQEGVTEKTHDEPSILHEESEATEKPHEEPEVTEKTHDEPSVSHEEPEATEKPHEEPEVTEKTHDEPSISHEEPEVTEKPHEEPEVTEKTHDEPSISHEEPEVTEKPHEEPEVTEKPHEEPEVTQKTHDEPSISHEEPEATEKPHEEPEVTEKTHDEPSISHEEPEATEKPHEEPEVTEKSQEEEKPIHLPEETTHKIEHTVSEEVTEAAPQEKETKKPVEAVEAEEEPIVAVTGLPEEPTHKPEDEDSKTTAKTSVDDRVSLDEESTSRPESTTVHIIKPVDSAEDSEEQKTQKPEVEHELQATQRPEIDLQKPVDHDAQVPEKPVEEEYSTTTHRPVKQPGYPQQPQSPQQPAYPSYPDDDYLEEDEDPAQFGPGTCRYGGKLYVSAQQIPRDDPCDFCFCFRSDIICLQQSCPPPIGGCHEEPIPGFCCPRYECHVQMATTLNITTSTTTTTTTLPPHFLQSAYKGAAKRGGCQIQGKAYSVGEEVLQSSGPCMRCMCGADGQMQCDPRPCSPEPMLQQMIAIAEQRRRR